MRLFVHMCVYEIFTVGKSSRTFFLPLAIKRNAERSTHVDRLRNDMSIEGLRPHENIFRKIYWGELNTGMKLDYDDKIYEKSII